MLYNKDTGGLKLTALKEASVQLKQLNGGHLSVFVARKKFAGQDHYMLQVVYEGYHWLNLGYAFRDVAWTSIYSGYHDDPLVQTISYFRSLLEARGAKFISYNTWLSERNKSKTQDVLPKLFIVSGYLTDGSLENILSEVKNGSNLVVILPQFAVVVHKNIEEKFKAFLNDISNELGSRIEEVKHRNLGAGQVYFFTGRDVDDLYVEAGPFGEPEQTTRAKKQSQISDIVKSIVTFRIPFLDCFVRSIPPSWPKDEGLVIELELFNRSEIAISEASVEINFISEFEPISSCQIDLFLLGAKASRSVSILTIPRKTGTFVNPLKMRVDLGETKYAIESQQLEIKVLDNLTRMMRFSEASHIPLATVLENYASYFVPIATPRSLLNLASNDPDSAVLKARRLGEHISKTIATRLSSDFDTSWTFARTTRELYERGLISSKAKGYIDHVRTLGNHAAHSDSDDIVAFSTEDAQQAYYALCLFLKDVKGTPSGVDAD